jgi:hypothetical protein
METHRLKPVLLEHFRVLLCVKLVEAFPLGQFLGAIETLAALAAAIGTIGQKEEDPKFQKASALGAMHVVAAAQRTTSFLGVHKQAKCAFHGKRMIAPCVLGCNRRPHLMLPKV